MLNMTHHQRCMRYADVFLCHFWFTWYLNCLMWLCNVVLLIYVEFILKMFCPLLPFFRSTTDGSFGVLNNSKKRPRRSRRPGSRREKKKVWVFPRKSANHLTFLYRPMIQFWVWFSFSLQRNEKRPRRVTKNHFKTLLLFGNRHWWVNYLPITKKYIRCNGSELPYFSLFNII